MTRDVPPTDPAALRAWADSTLPDADAPDVPPPEHPPDGPAGETVEVDGTELLDAVEAFLGRLVAFPSEHARVAATLWTAHAHVVDAAESSPRIAYLSPEPASGKTRALEAHAVLVPHPMHAISATPAAMFRAVADLDNRPTLLLDEADTIFGPKAKEHEELRALLNAGHRRSGVAYRCAGIGTAQKVVAFPAFAALALAGLGDLPDTLMSRSVVIRMRRRAPDERVEPFRLRLHEPEGHALRDRLAAWAREAVSRLDGAWPDLPEGVEDRPADVWEPMLTIADDAGGSWPQRAREACVALTAPEPGKASLGLQLLADVREAFGEADRMATEDLVAALHEQEEAPWGDLRGKPLDARGLAWRLGKYDVKPGVIRVDGTKTARGYLREHFHDAWRRYLPPPKQRNERNSVTAGGSRNSASGRNSEDAGQGDTVTAVTAVTQLQLGEGGNGQADGCHHPLVIGSTCDRCGVEVAS